MTPEQRAAASQVLYMNMIDYWYEVDLNGGAGVSEMYVEDGIFHGGGKPLVGRAAIEQFYTWRTNRGARISRHVITNFRAEFTDETHAMTYCVMMLYAADGTPVLPSAPPIIITDLIDRCVKCDDGKWRYIERTFVPLFMGGAPTTVPPESIAEKFNSDQKKD
ncbi:MAG TPA: nuclear transport factor 2 family protein [Steroidobacteraceae bacterium]